MIQPTCSFASIEITMARIGLESVLISVLIRANETHVDFHWSRIETFEHNFQFIDLKMANLHNA